MFKKFLIAIILLLFFSGLSIAAIVIDAGGTGTIGGANNTNTASFSITVGSNDNRILVVMCAAEGTDDTIGDSATYNSVSMTRIAGASQNNHSFGAGGIDTWYLLAPSTGSNTFTVNYDGAASEDIICGSMSFYNAKQQAEEARVDQEANNASITTVTDGALVIYGCHNMTCNTTATPSGFTEEYEDCNPDTNTETSGGQLIKATAGAQSIATCTNAEAIVGTAWEEAAVVGGPTFTAAPTGLKGQIGFKGQVTIR